LSQDSLLIVTYKSMKNLFYYYYYYDDDDVYACGRVRDEIEIEYDEIDFSDE